MTAERLHRKVVLVTGAAAGLGEAIAAAAARDGWTVGVLDRDPHRAEVVAAAIGGIALAADTTDEGAIDAALDLLAERTGVVAPDALVANAGIVRFGSLLDLDVADWRAVVEVNLTGTFLAARGVARRMAAAEVRGSIVTITSINGVAPGARSGAYGASKSAVALLTQQMAIEWGPLGIRVNAVAPGLIDAGMSEPIYADADIRQRRAERVPLGRLGTADDVAATVMFLLSDQASYVSGTEVVVDGGLTPSVIASLPRPAAVEGRDDR